MAIDPVDLIKHVLVASGAIWVLWLLGFLSIVSTAIVIERYVFYRRRECDLPRVARALGARLAKEDLEGAMADLAVANSVGEAIARAGLELAPRGAAAAEKAMASAMALERSRLERWLAYLGTLGNNAPFIGLFGTVVGVIGAFEELGKTGGTHAASQEVMARIAEALVTTAVGLMVALPAVVAFNYFQRRMARMLSGSEVLSNLVLAYIVKPDEVAYGLRK